ncbi:MAG TPA: hypothetical protein VEC18_06720, partial [Myxococcota bacterium]|nr:hypothetical protein [Myxococcota bacterium]
MPRRHRSSAPRNRAGAPGGQPESFDPKRRSRSGARLAALVLASTIGASAVARAQTQIGGVLESDATWSPAGNPYRMIDDVTVAAGATLTLLPGVVVKAVGANRELIVLGRLVARGTAARPIVITSDADDSANGDTNGDGSATRPAFGDWVGVGFAPSSPGGIGPFVEIRYAGYYGESGSNFAGNASDVASRVRVACTRCHLFPEAEILPRELWRDQLVVMRDLVGSLPAEAGGSPIGFSLREVAEWYEQQAPQSFRLLRSLTREGAGPLRFRRRPLELAADGTPAVATVVAVDGGRFGKRDFALAAVDMAGGGIYLLSRSEGPQRIAGAGHPVRAIPGDLNGDGLTDLVVSDLGDLALTDAEVGRVLAVLQQPAGDFTVEPILEGVGRVADARPLDCDLDGDLDVVVAAFGWRASGGVYLLRNQTAAGGPLRFRTERIVARAGAVSALPIPAREPGLKPGFAVAFAQQHELVSFFHPAAREAVQPARAADAALDYEEQVVYRAPHPNWGISNLESADLDGDGDLDFLIAHGDTLDDGFAFKPYQGVMWLENRGGEFIAHRIGALYGAHRAEAADLDGDGDLDVVAGAFLPQVAQPMPKQPFRVDSLVWFERTPTEWIPWSIEA